MMTACEAQFDTKQKTAIPLVKCVVSVQPWAIYTQSVIHKNIFKINLDLTKCLLFKMSLMLSSIRH